MATTGINEPKTKEAVHTILCACHCDTAVLYVKTLNYHWNMTGPQFFMYHRLLEEQYKEMAEALDEISERLRAIGFLAPGTMAEFCKNCSLKEGDSSLSQNAMVLSLINDHEKMAANFIKACSVCEDANDPGSADLCIRRELFHSKAAWLLRSNVEKNP